jgi:hypothetical protein
MLQHFHAIHAGQAQVQNHHFRPEPVEGCQAGLTAQFTGHFVAEALEVVADTAQNVDIVIDKQDGAGHADTLDRGDSVPPEISH